MYALVVQELVVQFLSIEFSIIPLNTEFHFHTIVVGKDILYDFSLLGFLKTCFVARHLIYPMKYSINMYSSKEWKFCCSCYQVRIQIQCFLFAILSG